MTVYTVLRQYLSSSLYHQAVQESVLHYLQSLLWLMKEPLQIMRRTSLNRTMSTTLQASRRKGTFSLSMGQAETGICYTAPKQQEPPPPALS